MLPTVVTHDMLLFSFSFAVINHNGGGAARLSRCRGLCVCLCRTGLGGKAFGVDEALLDGFTSDYTCSSSRAINDGDNFFDMFYGDVLCDDGEFGIDVNRGVTTMACRFIGELFN